MSLTQLTKRVPPCMCVRAEALHLHGEWMPVTCCRSARLAQASCFNSSHDVTFSLDYRRLDDGSPPGYSNNRWADKRGCRGVCVREVPPLQPLHLHVCVVGFNQNAVTEP